MPPLEIDPEATVRGTREPRSQQHAGKHRNELKGIPPPRVDHYSDVNAETLKQTFKWMISSEEEYRRKQSLTPAATHPQQPTPSQQTQPTTDPTHDKWQPRWGLTAGRRH